MVSFGFFDDWHPEPGILTTWTASTPARMAALRAPAHATPPSLQQRAYLLAAQRNAGAGFRASRLCMISFRLPGVPDRAAMTRCVNAFLRRHDTFASGFTPRTDGGVSRHVIDADLIEFVPELQGAFGNSVALREHVQQQTPGPFQWDCFSFGIIEHPHSYTVYAAVDHLHTDGISQVHTFVDLLQLYRSESAGTVIALPPVASHIDYCDREIRVNAELTTGSSHVRAWRDLLLRNQGDLPHFPLDLGIDNPGYTPGAQVTVPLFTGDEALRFEQVCADNAGRFQSGLLTALALTEYELADKDWYFGLMPVSTRRTPSESVSVGWYTNLVPVAVPVGRSNTFAKVVRDAQLSVERARGCTDISLHRVIELIAGERGIRTRPGWSSTMVSYLDGRKLSGIEMFDQVHGAFYSNPLNSGEVYLWVNRFADVTSMTVVYPDTVQAHESVGRYLERLSSICAAVAKDGDYAPRAWALS